MNSPLVNATIEVVEEAGTVNPLAPIKRNELNRAYGFGRSDMQDIETTRAGRCRMTFAQPRRTAKCSRPLNRRTNQAGTSQVTLQVAHAAATSAVVNRPRKTPNSNAFLTSSACNAVQASGALVLDK